MLGQQRVQLLAGPLAGALAEHLGVGLVAWPWDRLRSRPFAAAALPVRRVQRVDRGGEQLFGDPPLDVVTRQRPHQAGFAGKLREEREQAAPVPTDPHELVEVQPVELLEIGLEFYRMRFEDFGEPDDFGTDVPW